MENELTINLDDCEYITIRQDPVNEGFTNLEFKLKNGKYALLNGKKNYFVEPVNVSVYNLARSEFFKQMGNNKVTVEFKTEKFRRK